MSFLLFILRSRKDKPGMEQKSKFITYEFNVEVVAETLSEY
ncbi:hypothetical protein [Ornithinibacillus massiliensis]|nr:hypothetical protein [Ornithinibacillus massiliensis]